MKRLMESQNTIYCGNLSGLAYVKNSKDQPSNVHFYTSVCVNTADNTTKVSYKVCAFEEQADEFKQSYTSYEEAIAAYNKLVEEFSAHNKPKSS